MDVHVDSPHGCMTLGDGVSKVHEFNSQSLHIMKNNFMFCGKENEFSTLFMLLLPATAGNFTKVGKILSFWSSLSYQNLHFDVSYHLIDSLAFKKLFMFQNHAMKYKN